MTEDIETSTHPPIADDPPAAAGDEPAASGSSLQERVVALADERPETAIGASFAGGLLLALILRRIVR